MDVEELIMAWRVWDAYPGVDQSANRLEDLCQRAFSRPSVSRAAICTARRDGASLEEAIRGEFAADTDSRH